MTCNDVVVAITRVHRVRAASGDHDVVARPRVDKVVTVIAPQIIVPFAAGNAVVALGAAKVFKVAQLV